jgi:hypothetical protein
MQVVKQKLVSKAWDMDYIYFTESDQIMMARIMPLLYDNLKQFPGRMLLPHRLMPYSHIVINQAHKRDVSEDEVTLGGEGERELVDPASPLATTGPADLRGTSIGQGTVSSAAAGRANSSWMGLSCCMPRQNCGERKSWRKLADPSVPIVNVHGLYVPLGNVNFLEESFRACTLSRYLPEYCP